MTTTIDVELAPELQQYLSRPICIPLPKPGKVEINLDKNDNHIKITITDTGIGIPAADQQRVFDRFFRCDQSRSEDGCGLGLSFSRAVARSHNGDITLTSVAGTGSVFVISIPVRQE